MGEFDGASGFTLAWNLFVYVLTQAIPSYFDRLNAVAQSLGSSISTATEYDTVVPPPAPPPVVPPVVPAPPPAPLPTATDAPNPTATYAATYQTATRLGLPIAASLVAIFGVPVGYGLARDYPGGVAAIPPLDQGGDPSSTYVPFPGYTPSQ